MRVSQRSLPFPSNLVNIAVANNLANRIEIQFDWNYYKSSFKLWFIPISVAIIIGVFLVIKTVLLVPYTDRSFYSLFLTGINSARSQFETNNWFFNALLILGQLFATWLLIMAFLRLNFFPRTFRKKGFDLSVLAVEEEEVFRLKSEDWSLKQKALSCIVFGLLHVFALPILVFCVGFALIFAGAALMIIYLVSLKLTESQVKAIQITASVHTTYNLIAIGVFIVGIVSYFTNQKVYQILFGSW